MKENPCLCSQQFWKFFSHANFFPAHVRWTWCPFYYFLSSIKRPFSLHFGQRVSNALMLQLAPSVVHQAGAMLSLLRRYSWHTFSVISTESTGHEHFVRSLRDQIISIHDYRSVQKRFLQNQSIAPKPGWWWLPNTNRTDTPFWKSSSWNNATRTNCVSSWKNCPKVNLASFSSTVPRLLLRKFFKLPPNCNWPPAIMSGLRPSRWSEVRPNRPLRPNFHLECLVSRFGGEKSRREPRWWSQRFNRTFLSFSRNSFQHIALETVGGNRTRCECIRPWTGKLRSKWGGCETQTFAFTLLQ